MIQNEFRDYKIHPALKIGRKFDHALTRYDERHFVWNFLNIYYYATRLPVQIFTVIGRLCGESECTSCAREAARERHIVRSTDTFHGHVYMPNCLMFWDQCTGTGVDMHVVPNPYSIRYMMDTACCMLYSLYPIYIGIYVTNSSLRETGYFQ